MKSIILALLTGSLAAVNAADAKCRAIAFSSGDEDAAYQAGVLQGIVSSDKLTSDDWAYDAVSGVSGGALNAVMLSSFQRGDEVNAANRMEKFWTDASNSKLYKNWLGGVAQGLLFEAGLYNS
jgi:predicted acylesterase/phospholipase RssA